MAEAFVNTENLNFEKVWFMFQETDKKFQETKELFTQSSIEFDRRMLETEKLLKANGKHMKDLMKKVDEAELRWSKFTEALVEGTLLKLLKERGINVDTTNMREKRTYNDSPYEIDIIAKNGQEVVAVEVKTTLKNDDVKDYLKKLTYFREALPEYAQKTVYGAVAYISADKEAITFAAKHGLFVIKATNESAKILNRIEFKPKVW